MTKIFSNFVIVAAALGAASTASAQAPTRLARPWKVELGAYIPNTNLKGVDENVGGTLAIGYNIARFKDTYDLEIEVRGTGYTLDGFGDTADVSIGQWLLNGTYHPATEKYFFGVGVGIGRGDVKINNVTLNDTNTDFVWQVSAGYNFQPNVYGVVRLHGGDYSGYRGYSIAAGYRF